MPTLTSKPSAVSGQAGTSAPVAIAAKLRETRCSLRETCRRVWRARRTRAELAALSDPELKDMGLFRGDIGRVAVENYS